MEKGNSLHISKFENNNFYGCSPLVRLKAHRIFGFTLAGFINSCANTKGLDGKGG